MNFLALHASPQFFETEATGGPALLFMGSAMPSCLEDMVGSGLHLSDFPAHDMSRDRVLLADCVKVSQRTPAHLDTNEAFRCTHADN